MRGARLVVPGEETGAGQMRGGGLAGRVGMILCLAVVLFVAGCGNPTASGDAESETENRRLREENERLREDAEEPGSAVAGSGPETDSTVPETVPETTGQTEPEPRQQETEPPGKKQASVGSGGGTGGTLAVAGADDVSGEPLPEVMPDDFALPAGAMSSYVYEDDTSFSLDFVLDSDHEQLASFFDEQLATRGWQETGRTEGETEGLRWVETTWERGTFVPQGSPQGDPNYEQPEESLTLTTGEVEPAGVGAVILWRDDEAADRKYQEDSGQESSDTSRVGL